MKQFITILLVVFSVAQVRAATDWTLAWKVEDLPSPESTVFDSTRNIVFISNQNYAQEKGGGSIGKLTVQGAVIEKEWVKGLNKPKGILVMGNKLFVSDVTELVEIDIEKSAIVKRHAAKDAQFLNDVATDGKGAVYVSDMFTSAIYRLERDGRFGIWMQDPALENPNGLLFHDGALFISAWGRFSDGKPMDAPKGHLLRVDLKTKKIQRLTSAPLGNLDGIVPMGKLLLVSDWIAGGVFEVTAGGKATQIIKTEQSAGDIAFLPEQDLILIPMAKQGQVLAYKKSKRK